jgi:hypothetical protein
VAVYVQQLVDGEPQPEVVVEPHRPDQSDEELLRVKAQGADDKDWDVEWLGDSSFVARKVRWQHAAMCERIFEVR